MITFLLVHTRDLGYRPYKRPDIIQYTDHVAITIKINQSGGKEKNNQIKQ